ncbi:MAG TPA: ABC transporter substrate-binding protein [Clostridia bacterium]|jgi:branched-chain amino acid transport system substrate-binding protein|nr:ABC transporter substrate-binding protein [Clostridia bacterium]
MQKLRKLVWISLLLMVVLVFTGCGQQGETSKQDEETIKIGTVGPLSGDTATYGVSTKNGVEIAIEEINNSGGINGKKITLIPQDSKGDQAEAANATQKLISQDNVSAIIGAVLSSETLAAAPIANDAGIPMISSSATAPGVPDVGPFIFRNCIADQVQAAQLAEYAVKELNLDKFAVLYTKNDYGEALKDTFVETLKSLDKEPLVVESYVDGDNDFSAQITKIAAQKPQAIYVGGYYTEAAKIAQQAKQKGLEVIFLGGDGFYSPKLLELGGDAVEGVIFTAGFYDKDPDENVQKFVAAYKAKFNEDPDMFAAQAYDAAMILIEAIKKAGTTDPAAIQAELAKTKDFPGITGKTSFTENGDAVKDILILKVENGAFKRIR